MGTTLHAFVQQHFNGDEHMLDHWETINTWEFNKDYEFSMALEDIKGHGWPNDTKPESSDPNQWNDIEWARERWERLQCFQPSEIVGLKTMKDLWPRAQSLIASLESLLKTIEDKEIRVLFYRA